jgi:transposase, IS6 family
VSRDWRHICPVVDEQGQVIDVFVSKKRDTKTATRFFTHAIAVHGARTEVTTDRAPALARAIADLLPTGLHDATRYADNRVETDRGRLKARLRSMRSFNVTGPPASSCGATRSSRTCGDGTTKLGVDPLPGQTLAAAFDELALVI